MYQSLTDEEFVNEMKILWQKAPQRCRNKLSEIIRDYFDAGDRSVKIIQKMQEQIETEPSSTNQEDQP